MKKRLKFHKENKKFVYTYECNDLEDLQEYIKNAPKDIQITGFDLKNFTVEYIYKSTK